MSHVCYTPMSNVAPLGLWVLLCQQRFWFWTSPREAIFSLWLLNQRGGGSEQFWCGPAETGLAEPPAPPSGCVGGLLLLKAFRAAAAAGWAPAAPALAASQTAKSSSRKLDVSLQSLDGWVCLGGKGRGDQGSRLNATQGGGVRISVGSGRRSSCRIRRKHMSFKHLTSERFEETQTASAD